MAGPIRISILANGAQARREATVTARAYTGMGGAIKRGGALLGLTGLAAAAVGVTKSAINLEGQFSQTMNMIRASTDAPSAELEKMRGLAMKLGADTSYSANEAADAMLELAKAGIDTKTIMGGGVAGTLQLAAAGGTELGTAATIASNALNAFNLEGRDMAAVAAALAGGANASSASVESLGQGLQQVGPSAVNAGLSIQETVAALSAFDAAGVKGSDAGTSLKTMLARLVPDNEKAAAGMETLGVNALDAEGNFRSLTDIAGQLQRGMKGLSDAERTRALNAAFGSDASRAAIVLSKEGAAGLRDYVKATNDQGAAQKMAEARMEGTKGALERLSGAVETAQLKLGQKLSPAVTKGADVLADKLVPAMESGIDMAEEFGRTVEPAVKAVIGVLEDLVPSASEAGGVFDNVLIPSVRVLATLVEGAAKAVDALPDPIKGVALQAGIAALVLPRLSAAATSAGVAMRNGATYARVLGLELRDASSRAALAQTAMTRLSGAAKTAAGIGGMVALTSAAGASNKALSALGMTAGGAMLGFSVGGPWGAAIGGGAGLLAGLWSATRKADGATASLGATAAAQQQKIDDLAGAFHGLSGAIDETTRKTALKELSDRDMLGTLQMVGVSTRDAIDATLGNEGAQRRVAAAINQARDAAANIDPLLKAQGQSGTKLAQAADAAAGGMKRLGFDMSEARLAAIENYRATAPLGQLYRGLPKKAITEIRTKGAPESLKDVRRLKRQFDLTPKQIRTVLRAANVPATRKEIENLSKRARDLGRQRPTVRVNANTKVADGAVSKIDRALRKVSSFVAKPVAELDDKASKQTNAARDRLQNLGKMNPRPVVSLTDRATVPINSIRDNLGRLRDKSITITTYERTIRTSGGGGGGGGAAPRMAPGALIPRAGDLLERAAGKRAESAGTRLIRRLLKGVDAGSQGASKAVERLNSYIERTINSRIKDDKKAAARTKAILNGLADEQKALAKNGREQDRNQRKLDTAIQKHKDLVDAAKQYAATIKDSIVTFGDVTELGRKDGSDKVSLGVMLTQLEQRAESAKRYATLIEQLRKSGLNSTSIQDLLDKGPEAGLATAEAIAGGGAAAVDQINKLTKDLAGTGGKLGDQMKNAYHSAGIKAAQGLVDGLEKSQKRLEKVAQKLANAMTKAVKKALGIKSPSRVFRDVGDQTVKGLAIGLDETYVKRQGQRVATSLRDGFGTPALDAYASSGGATSARAVTVTLRAEEVDRLRRGKEIQMDLDFYQAHGGRARATGKVGG